jgi:SAM-dependent methyltransferase
MLTDGRCRTGQDRASSGLVRAGEHHQVINSSAPSPFVEGWVSRIAAEGVVGRTALDVAMGRGRHALCLAAAGFQTFGVDLELDSVATAVRAATDRGLVLRGWRADLRDCVLPSGCFDLVVVTRYLQRDLFAALRESLAPEGLLLYETFTVAQRRHGTGPTSSDHLLEHRELLARAAPLTPLFYEEIDEPDAVARLVARRSRSLA